MAGDSGRADRAHDPAYTTRAVTARDPLTHDDPPPDALSTRRRRLLYRSRLRGTHENDLLLGRFAAEAIPGMDDAALDAWEAVLELPDVDLFDWISGRFEVPVEHDSAMLRRLIAHANAPHAKAGQA
jgi:antitoxin CptB